MNSRTDRRPAQQAASKARSGRSRKSGFGGTMVGLFIGIALGLALAAAVAFYLAKGATPYQSTAPARESPREPAKELAKPGRADPFAPEKPRFDFYRILPGGEEAKVHSKPGERGSADKSTAERAVSPDKADAKSANKTEARVVTKADERPAGADAGREAQGRCRALLAAGGIVCERGRCRGPQGEARVRRVGSVGPVRHAAGQERPLSRAPGSLRQHRRAPAHEERSRCAGLRRRGDQILIGPPRCARRGFVRGAGTRVVASSPRIVTRQWRLAPCTCCTY